MSREPDSWYWEETWGDFRRGSVRVGVEWGDDRAEARLYDEGVPKTVAGLLERLPLTVPVVHVAWSGEMVMSARAFDLGVNEEENRVRLVRPGDLSWDPKFGELAFTYGTAECRLPSGSNTVVVYGIIDLGLEGFAAFGKARRFQGLGQVVLTKPRFEKAQGVARR